MAFEVILPRLGWDMEEGTLGGWLKEDGEFVNAGEMLFSIEGDKAVQEVEALDSGYLRIAPNAPALGVKVPVGTLLGYLVPEAELATFSPPDMAEAVAPITAQEAAGQAPEAHQSAALASDLAPNERAGRRVYISPYARRMAEQSGVDWHSVAGSGRAGRIMARDIKAVIAQKAAEAQPSVAQPATAIPVVEALPVAVKPVSAAAERTAMSAVRRSIAEHMAASAHTVAPVTLTCEVDASQLVTLRKQLKEDAREDGGPGPSFNDILAKICAQALMEHPQINAFIDSDEIVLFPSAHVAIAVDTERGLLVPVLRDVQTKSLRQVARESALLIEKTRRGTVAYEDLQGGTFTITNLGMFEIEAFTPIINLPQCAILGVGQIIPKQVVVDADLEKVAIQHRMALSLTFDHRLVDGAQAARFLQRIKRLVEKPFLWLAGQ